MIKPTGDDAGATSMRRLIIAAALIPALLALGVIVAALIVYFGE